jgi:TM2 domain-containing membrane protein YozV
MFSPPAQPLSRNKARSYAILNLFGTPGLGSFLAGRRWTGAAQILIAVTGFALVTAWFVQVAMVAYRSMYGDVQEGDTPSGRLALIGLGLFLIAWAWSAVTSMFLLRSVPPEPPAFYK